MNHKRIKADARTNLKAHYLLLVSLCVVYTFIGVNRIPYFTYFTGDRYAGIIAVIDSFAGSSSMTSSIGIVEEASGVIAKIDNINPITQNGELVDNIGPVELSTDDGVLANIVNRLTSRSLITSIASGIKSIVKSETAGNAISIIAVMLVAGFLWFFVIRVYEVICTRLILESRIYRSVPLRRSFFLIRCGKWFKTGWNLLIYLLVQLLWTLTIVGGIIKFYEYSMVPYILAENPDVSIKQALKLSSRLMKGHKWDLFKLRLSFIGWRILDLATLGLFGILFTGPYMSCSLSEYYTLLRQDALLNRTEGHELLIDHYLFELPDENTLREAYEDVYELLDNPPAKPEDPKGFTGFLSRNFGVVIFATKKEMERSIYSEQMTRIEGLRKIRERLEYPPRLFPIPKKFQTHRLDYMHYMRRYSVFSLTIMFFIFCFIGWLWEVSYHLVEAGNFVNRGTLNGPWLPIYGSGGLIVLLLLYRLRKRPIISVIVTTVLCGIIEYGTAWFLDFKFGKKWWDYTGYFLNIQGRVCAEGLMAFAIGATLMVYVLAPILDNFLTKLRLRVAVPICIIMTVLFVSDIIYSGTHPNTGEGITEFSVPGVNYNSP